MRYVIQTMVMIGDIAVLAAIIISIFVPCEWSMKAFILVIDVLGFNAWKQSGGFMAWKTSNIRIFLNNAKKIGL